MNLLQNSDAIHIRPTYLTALGSVRTDKLIDRALDFAFLPLAFEAYEVLSSLTKHKAGKQKVWEWFKANIKKIENTFNGRRDRGGRVIAIYTKSLGTRAQLKDLKDWFDDYKGAVSCY